MKHIVQLIGRTSYLNLESIPSKNKGLKLVFEFPKVNENIDRKESFYISIIPSCK